MTQPEITKEPKGGCAVERRVRLFFWEPRAGKGLYNFSIAINFSVKVKTLYLIVEFLTYDFVLEVKP